MVTCVNGIVVCKICWLAMLVRKSVIWLSMPRISLGPALLKPLSRSDVPPPAVVVKEIWGTVGPELVPNGEGMVMVSVADARFDDPIWIPPPTVAVMVKVAPLNVGVTCTLEGTSSEASSLELELTSRGARSMDATIGGWPARLIEALRRLRLTVAVIALPLAMALGIASIPQEVANQLAALAPWLTPPAMADASSQTTMGMPVQRAKRSVASTSSTGKVSTIKSKRKRRGGSLPQGAIMVLMTLPDRAAAEALARVLHPESVK